MCETCKKKLVWLMQFGKYLIATRAKRFVFRRTYENEIDKDKYIFAMSPKLDILLCNIYVV